MENRFAENSLSDVIDDVSSSSHDIVQRESTSSLPVHPTPIDERERIARKIYSPILQWETRILAIPPGAEGDPLIADLEVVTFTQHKSGVGLAREDRMLEYEALSYT